MNSLLVIFAIVGMASAIPMKWIRLDSHSQESEYSLKTDHPVNEPPTIIKGVPKPYAVPVPRPYAVPRPVMVEVPRAVPVTVTRTIPVPIVQRGEPIIRTRVVRVNDDDDDDDNMGSLSLGGGYGSDNGNGYGNDNGNGYGKLLSLDDGNDGHGLSLGRLSYSKY